MTRFTFKYYIDKSYEWGWFDVIFSLLISIGSYLTFVSCLIICAINYIAIKFSNSFE